MRFPTGGIVRERASAGPDSGAGQDLVKFQNRQYSLDERRWQDAGSSLRLCVQMVQTALECFYIPEFFIPQAEAADNRGCSKNIPIVPYIEPPLPWTISFRAVFVVQARQAASSLHEMPCAGNGAQERPVQEVAGWKTETI